MTDTTETRSAFERWLRGAHSPAHARRTAACNAAFMLPHLRPGMRLLDAGCGPGSNTIGLAEAVAPGEVIGVAASGRRMLRTLDREIAALDAAIDRCVSSDRWRRTAEIVGSVPGIGAQSTRVRLTGLPELGTLNE
jgi:cyclopropane fatty-acyl-phospholipid synthase-like methyltransferase